MSLKPGEEIGNEIHPTSDQLFFFVDGTAKVTVGDNSSTVNEHDVVAVPAGTRHNVQNIGGGSLKLFTIYAPPAHADGLVHATKADAATEAE
jgi:mannose-6-phosphate isomerase-like protein (cupin superfamily)